MPCYLGGEHLQINYPSQTWKWQAQNKLLVYVVILQPAGMFSKKNAALGGAY